jgi:adenylosuccinate synthase
MTFIERETGVEIDYISYGPRTEEMKTRNDLIMNI